MGLRRVEHTARARGSMEDGNEKQPPTEIEVWELEFLPLTHIYLSRTCSAVSE